MHSCFLAVFVVCCGVVIGADTDVTRLGDPATRSVVGTVDCSDLPKWLGRFM